MNKRIYIPKGITVIIAIFVFIMAVALVRDTMDFTAGFSMACLFSSAASLIAYIISAIKKRKSGVYLFAFVILFIGMIVSTLFTEQYAQSKDINTTETTTTYEG